jgi:F-type H+-transporting ATPase subunit c
MEQSAKYIGSGLCVISLGGAAMGAGLIFGAFVLGTSRNPSLRGELFSISIIGFALCEAIGLFGLMMSFLILLG